MPTPTNQTDDRILDIHIETASQIAAHRKCILAAKAGCGFAPITVKSAVNLNTGRILVIAPRSITGMWAMTLRDVMSEAYPDMSGERIMDFTGKGRQGGSAAFAAAAGYAHNLPLVCVITPEQAASAGSWQTARDTSPFGLIVVDSADMYSNRRSERSRGLEDCLAKSGAYILIARTSQALQRLSTRNLPIVNAVRLFEDAMAANL